MSNEKRYNGWRNYETWSVPLVFDNDQHTHDMRRQAVSDIADRLDIRPDADPADLARFRYAVSDWISEHLDSYAPDFHGVHLGHLWSQLLGAAISEVDCDEIAAHWVDDCLDDMRREGVA